MEPGVFFGMAEGLKSAEDLSSGSCSMYTTLFFPYFKLYLSEPSFLVLSIRSGLCLFFLVYFLLVLELSNMYNPRSNVPQKGELSWKSLHLRNSVESTTWTFPPEVFLCDFCCSTGFFSFMCPLLRSASEYRPQRRPLLFTPLFLHNALPGLGSNHLHNEHLHFLGTSWITIPHLIANLWFQFSLFRSL